MKNKSVAIIFLSVSFLSLTLAFYTKNLTAQTSFTYYVSTTGNDNQSDGTITKPFRTLKRAIELISPGRGNVVYVRGGAYNLTPETQPWIGKSGASNAPIVIQSYPNEIVVLDGSNLPGKPCIGTDKNYVVIKGFHLTKCHSAGITTWGASFVTIQNNRIYDIGHKIKSTYEGSGITVGGTSNISNIKIINNNISNTYNGGIVVGNSSKNWQVSDVHIEGNEVWWTNKRNESKNLPGGWSSGISVARSNRVKAFKNKVHKNFGEGMICTVSKFCHFYENTVFDNYSVLMYMDNATDSVYERNFMYISNDREASFFFRKNTYDNLLYPATGIQMANEVYHLAGTTPNPLNRNKILNNIVVNASSGFYYGSYEDKVNGIKNLIVANNTFFTNKIQPPSSIRAIVHIDYNPGSRSVIFANNIFYKTPQGKILDCIQQRQKQPCPPKQSEITFKRNLWFGGRPQAASSLDDLYWDPKFVRPGDFKSVSYKVLSGSPVIDKALREYAPLVDFFGARRPRLRGFDLGAHEW